MKELLFKLAGAILLGTSLALGWLIMDYQGFADRPLTLGEEGLDLVVEPGAALSPLVRRLAARGVIEKPHYVRIMARLRGDAHRIQAGEYHLPHGTTPVQFLDMLIDGRVRQHTLTIIEGWTFQQMMAAIQAHPKLRHTLESAQPDAVMARLGYPEQHPEGRFFPDTYHFPRGTTDVAFLQRAYEAMEARLAAEWAQRQPDLPLQSPYEALILASIIERETGLSSERHDVAGVFIRRLRLGMRLQTDPTVIYGLGDDFGDRLRRADLRRDTPYNTYTRHGLPPTPIAMPSGASINAALNPAHGETLYFVSRGDGSHHFSKTLEEHNRAVDKYIRGR